MISLGIWLDFRSYAAASAQASRMAWISAMVGSPGQGSGRVRLALMIHGDRSLPWDGCRAE
jgi:hypothetical protein